MSSTFTINEGSQITAIAAASLASRELLTYYDVVVHLHEVATGMGTGAGYKVMRGAVRRSYDEVAAARDWPWLKCNYRVSIPASQTDGTVAYDHDTLQVTLTGATWPAAVEVGWSLYLDDVVCDVAARDSSTVLTLTSERNPGADVAAGASYTLFKRLISLPLDFVSLRSPLGESWYRLGREVSADVIAQKHLYNPTTGELERWAIAPHPLLLGRQAIHIYPANSTEVYRLDLPYRKRPRRLRYHGSETAASAGTISVDGSTVTGSGTSFSDKMAGSVLWVSSDTTPPGTLDENNPYDEALLIGSVESATSLTLVEDGTTVSGKGYRISDPIDFPPEGVQAMLACAEKHLARARGWKDYRMREAEYLRQLDQAYGHTRPVRRVEVMRSGGGAPYRLRNDYDSSDED